mmetsp:Transcript_35403/g.72870  ORF Transcript_35403/g.72870 Transcript_35403/m.72870 type:complete len:211 (-) Transcript_35403:490-1122(-)
MKSPPIVAACLTSISVSISACTLMRLATILGSLSRTGSSSSSNQVNTMGTTSGGGPWYRVSTSSSGAEAASPASRSAHSLIATPRCDFTFTIRVGAFLRLITSRISLRMSACFCQRISRVNSSVFHAMRAWITFMESVNTVSVVDLSGFCTAMCIAAHSARKEECGPATLHEASPGEPSPSSQTAAAPMSVFTLPSHAAVVPTANRYAPS